MNRRRIVTALCGSLLLGSMSLAIAADADDPGVREILSGIDFVPAKDALDAVLGGEADGDLIDIARNNNGASNDPGVRIRAYRALRHYPSLEVQDALTDAVVEHSQVDGLETLYTRAAIEALALVGGEDAVSDISPLLAHERRDVRAAAARALQVINSETALPALRTQLQRETVLQVKLAISEAIRELTGAPTPQ